MHEPDSTGTSTTARHDVRPTAGHRLRTREVGGLVFAEAKYRPHISTPWHSHELTSVEIVLGGSYVKRTMACDYECVPGTVTLEPPGDSHSGIYGPCGWHAVLIEVSPLRLATLEVLGVGLRQPVCHRTHEALLLGRRLSVELQRTDRASSLVLEGIALELIAVALRTDARVDRRVPPAWLRRVIEQLRDEFRDEIRLDMLASTAGVHSTHLARTFRAFEGCTIGEFIRRERIAWAAGQLIASTLPIAHLARAAGFYDQSHFTRAFKAYIGLSPARYRALGATTRRG